MQTGHENSNSSCAEQTVTSFAATKAAHGLMRSETCLGHGAPDFGTLDIGNVAGPGEVQPVGLVQLGADEEVEVGNALVLTHQGGCQAQLAVRLHNANDL